MKPTGKKFPDWHPNAGDEIMQIEKADITFWDKEWKDLTIDQKGDFLSYKKIPFLNKDMESSIVILWNSERYLENGEG